LEGTFSVQNKPVASLQLAMLDSRTVGLGVQRS
jgi:hypothetical protein